MNADGSNAKAPARSDSVGALIQRLEPQLEKALPKHVTADRMARVALTAIRQNPKLQQADPMSLIASVMVAAQLGLEPNTPLGHCYIIPYKTQAQFQIGYKCCAMRPRVLRWRAWGSPMLRRLTARLSGCARTTPTSVFRLSGSRCQTTNQNQSKADASGLVLPARPIQTKELPMSGRHNPTTERQDRIANIRLQLYAIGRQKRERDLTIAEAYTYQQLNLELQRLMAEEGHHD